MPAIPRGAEAAPPGGFRGMAGSQRSSDVASVSTG